MNLDLRVLLAFNRFWQIEGPFAKSLTSKCQHALVAGIFKPIAPNLCANCIIAVGRFSKIDGFVLRCESRPTCSDGFPITIGLTQLNAQIHVYAAPYALLITHYFLSYPQVIHNLCTFDIDVKVVTPVSKSAKLKPPKPLWLLSPASYPQSSNKALINI